MVIQFYERMNHQLYIEKRFKDLTDISGDKPLYISDNQMIFFLIAKDENVRNELESVLERYINRNKSLFSR